MEQSHAVWGDVKKGKILFADSHDNIADEIILFMRAYKNNSDIITDVEIYFKNFETPAKLAVEEVPPIIATYMPYDIMEQYYQYSGSELIVPDEAADKDNYYVISYSLTEEAGDAYYKKEHEYSGSMDVIICTDSVGIVKSASIDFGTPNWMSRLSRNSYHSEEWNCDLFTYRQKD